MPTDFAYYKTQYASTTPQSSMGPTGTTGTTSSAQFTTTGLLACAGAQTLNAKPIYYNKQSMPPVLPEEGHDLVPWVEMAFCGGDSRITVSNQSSPYTNPKNVACITSFEHGGERGHKVNVTIHDQEGGNFAKFLDHLVKDWKSTSTSMMSTSCDMQYGWIKNHCDQSNSYQIVHKTPCMRLKVMSIEAQLNKGLFFFNISLIDPIFYSLQGSCSVSFGEMSIGEALRRLWTNPDSGPPLVDSVVFLKRDSNGNAIHCGFDEVPNETRSYVNANDLVKGPVYPKWEGSGQDKYHVGMNWIKDHPADDKKPWVCYYNSIQNRVEYWQKVDVCEVQSEQYFLTRCIGKYIANGGNNSPVLEFNPVFNWNFATVTGSGGHTGTSELAGLPPSDITITQTNNGWWNWIWGNTTYTATVNIPQVGGGVKLSAVNKKCQGTQADSTDSSVGQTQQVEDDNNHDQPTAERATNQAAAINANKIYSAPISADLVLVGDPSLFPVPYVTLGAFVYIVYVNPFYIAGDYGTFDWIATSPIANEVLTNAAWLITEVNHKIELGRYTTTLKLNLSAPGIDGPSTDVRGNPIPIGLNPGGYRPKRAFC